MAGTRTPGERIARLREMHGLTRDALAERSGLDSRLIERIEVDGFVPDLAPLVRLARALGVRLGTFMDDQEQLGPVITRSGQTERSARFVTGAPDGDGHRDGLDFTALATGKVGRHMEPFFVDVKPGENVLPISSHEGEEFIFVLSGKILVHYGIEVYELAEGDSIYYDSIIPHRVETPDSVAARILAVVYAPF